MALSATQPAVLLVRGIRAIVLDLDDTLYPERSFCLSGFDAVGQWLRQRLDCPIDPVVRMRELFASGERGHIFDRLLEEIRCEPSAELIAEMVACYRTHGPAIQLFDDAEAALERWKGRFRLGLISDGPLVMQQNKARCLGLYERLDRIVLTDEWGSEYWKPHPRAFELIESEFGCRGNSCLYVADNPCKDFIAPSRLGWQTIWLRRPGGLYCHAPVPPGGRPDHELTTLRHLDVSF
ncbi:MAG: hypothetical protein AMXMBFR13_18630 [Phycisphaerae bacterium]